jgi:hypothetical protein
MLVTQTNCSTLIHTRSRDCGSDHVNAEMVRLHAKLPPLKNRTANLLLRALLLQAC